MDIGLENVEGTIERLNTLLADEHVLYMKTRNYHWNIQGAHFSEYHKMLEEQYEELAAAIDDIAERTRQLGGRPKATLKEVLAGTRLQESPGSYPEAQSMLKELLGDHERIIKTLREDIAAAEDVGTEDYLTGLIQQHEKVAWMLRAATT